MTTGSASYSTSIIGRDIAIFGDDEGNFLVLIKHLLLGQHRGYVARERGHVVQAERLEVGRGQNREHARHRLGLGRVDFLDTGMGVRRAREVAIQHAGQLQVVDIVAFALNETDVLDALALAADALELFGPFGGGGGHVVHSAASWNGTPPIFATAY
jgi:hypothetical protein